MWYELIADRYGAFTAAALVWFLCTTLLPTKLLSRGYYHPVPRYEIPPDIILEQCVSDDDWSNQPSHHYRFPFTAATTFKLPLSAENLLLISRGPRLSRGRVEIVTSPQQNQDVATVQVVVGYFKQDVRDEAKVCYIRRGDGEIGVGIFTPERSWPGGRRHKLHIAAKSDFVDTVHRIGDLNKKVLFQSLLLKGHNAGIRVASVQADRGIIETSYGSITEIFNTSRSLALVARIGRINADIGLLSINATEPHLILMTNYSPVTSRISLISDIGQGGSFHVTASTSNGHLRIDFPAASPDSLLTFNGTTSNAYAVVSLNPAYEGSFFVQTSRAEPRINQDESVTDPSGRNRNRSLTIKPLEISIVGKVYWKDATEQDGLKPAGAVLVRSSNVRVELNL